MVRYDQYTKSVACHQVHTGYLYNQATHPVRTTRLQQCVWGNAGASSGSDAAGVTALHVHQLLSSIPQDLLARAAAQCGAHARALLHYETHLRSKEGGGLNPVAHKNAYYSDDEVSFLQVRRGGISYSLLVVSRMVWQGCTCWHDGWRGLLACTCWHDGWQGLLVCGG